MFPGNPHDHSPCASTPAGPSTRYGTKGQRTRHGPRTKAQRGLPTVANFGAQSHGFWSRCLRLEVEVTRHRARLASGCWSQLCRAGFQPAGFLRKVSEHSTRPPLPSFLRAALFWRFSITAISLPPHSQATILTLHAPRRHQRGQAMRRPSRWLLHATDRRIGKNRTGPDLDEHPLYKQRPKTRLEPSRVVLYPFAQHSVRHGDPLEHHGGRYDAPPLASRHRLQILGT